MMWLHALLAAHFLLAANLVAQESTALPPRPDAHPGRAIGIDIFPTPGKPFSGRDCVDLNNVRKDASVETSHLDGAVVARDSQGRVYREIRTWVPAEENRPSRLDSIILLDPVAHTRTECTVATRHCKIASLHQSASRTETPANTANHDEPDIRRESLGNDVIEGLDVEGVRVTLLLDAGAVPDKNLPVTVDRWYSPDLEIDLSVIRRLPDGSTQWIHVVNLSRDEPDAAMFHVPQGFAVFDQRGTVAPQMR